MKNKSSSAPFEETEGKKARKVNVIHSAQGIFNNYSFLIIMLLIGFGISITSYIMTSTYEEARTREAFEEEALHDITSAIVNTLDSALYSVIDVAAFFNASDFVSRHEFNIYVKHDFEFNSGIQTLEWIPYVPDEEREAYEAAAREDGLLDFQFKEHQSQGDMVPREQQAAYFPVFYLEPLAGNEAAMGFDLGSNPERLAALEQARDTGESAASAPITLVQEQGNQSGFLVFQPVYSREAPVNTIEERRNQLKGFSLGVFRISDLLDAALAGLTEEGIHLRVYDLGAAEGGELIYEQGPNREVHSQPLTSLTASKVIDIAGRSWRLEFIAHQSFVNQYKTNLPWILLTGGFVLTSVVSIALFNSGRQTNQLKQAHTKMKGVADELSQLIDTANAPIFGVDRQGLVNEWNQASERLTGFTKEEVIGRNLVQDFITEEYQAPVQAVQDKALQGIETRNFEFLLYTKTRDRVLVLLNATARKNTQGKIVGVIGFGQDITELDQHRHELETLVKKRTAELNQALGELKEVDLLKTEFLSTAAHELRTPLTSIQGFSEILLTRQITKERQTRFITMINEQAIHLAQTIDDLLDISRLEAGRGMEIASEPIDMTDLMNETMLPLIEANPDHQFQLEGLQEYPPLMGDPFRLAQVGKNIISNAIKYSPEGGEIVIHGRVIEDHLEISVQDEGIGMTPEQQKHLFEKFYRADASNTSISGTGLGLAISKTIVELHGGRIWIESEAGVGTTVYILLPLIEREMDMDI